MGKKNRDKSRQKSNDKKSESSSTVELNLEDSEGLLKRIESNEVTSEDLKLLGALVQWYLWLVNRVSQVGRGLGWLKKALGLSLEKSTESPEKSTGENEDPKDSPNENESPEEEPSNELPESKKPKSRPGHNRGRLKASDYWGAEVQKCAHESLKVGDSCPGCGGRLHELKQPSVEIRIKGSPLASAIRYDLQRLRCSSCKAVYTARLPDEAHAQKYDERIRAILALMTHSQGMPAKRIESFQAALGVPLPDSTQWDLNRALSEEIKPVYDEFFLQAAQSHLIYQDDTGVRILELMQENQRLNPKKDRTGMHTTGIVAEGGTPDCVHRIVLYLPGRNHAGENLADLLAKRRYELPDPLQMSDALSANQSGDFKSISLLCNAHAVRKFKALTETYPDEASWILDMMKEVYQNDEYTRKKGFTGIQRLVYHQTLSAPIMEAIQQWMLDKFEQKQVQPNEELGKAFNYMLKRWWAFIGFTLYENAPLDNSLCERMLKLAIRHRNQSLFYKNTSSAQMGARLTSVIQTCIEAGKNPLDYLVALQKHFVRVAQEPQKWLPWNYEQTLTLLH